MSGGWGYRAARERSCHAFLCHKLCLAERHMDWVAVQARINRIGVGRFADAMRGQRGQRRAATRPKRCVQLLMPMCMAPGVLHDAVWAVGSRSDRGNGRRDALASGWDICARVGGSGCGVLRSGSMITAPAFANCHPLMCWSCCNALPPGCRLGISDDRRDPTPLPRSMATRPQGAAQ